MELSVLVELGVRIASCPIALSTALPGLKIDISKSPRHTQRFSKLTAESNRRNLSRHGAWRSRLSLHCGANRLRSRGRFCIHRLLATWLASGVGMALHAHTLRRAHHGSHMSARDVQQQIRGAAARNAYYRLNWLVPASLCDPGNVVETVR